MDIDEFQLKIDAALKALYDLQHCDVPVSDRIAAIVQVSDHAENLAFTLAVNHGAYLPPHGDES